MSWGLRSLLLGMTALLGLGGSSAAARAIEALPDYDVPSFIVRRSGGSRSYGTTPGGRAHQRWKRARASGINPRVRHG